MYDIISSIIDHNWTNDYTSSQQIIYYICGAMIIIVVSVLIDNIFKLFRRIWKY